MNLLFKDYYKDKKVLVTGNTGFKGSWLSLWLLKLGAKVAGLSSYIPSDPSNFEVLEIEKQIKYYSGDISDFGFVRNVFREFKPDVVFHLAAQPIVKKSYDDPKLTFDSNLGGTVNILETLRLEEKVQAAVIITSDKCYRNVEWPWGYRENDDLGGEDPYSASKGCAEIAINSYCKSFFNNPEGIHVASTRAGNVIGGGDWAENRIIPDCMRAWSKGETVIIRNPGATRPWQHVLEALSGYLALGVMLGSEKILSGEAFNFGPRADVVQPVGELIETIKNYWQSAQSKIVEENSPQKESGLLKLCCDKAHSLLKWQAILSFEETIELTALWYKNYYEGLVDMSEFSEKQIDWYCALALERKLDWAS